MKIILRTACGAERVLDGDGWEVNPIIRVPLGVNTIGVTRLLLLDMLVGTGWREFRRSRVAVASNAAEFVLGFEQTVLYQESGTICTRHHPHRPQMSGLAWTDADVTAEDVERPGSPIYDHSGRLDAATIAKIVTACGCIRLQRIEGLQAEASQLSQTISERRTGSNPDQPLDSHTYLRTYQLMRERRIPVLPRVMFESRMAGKDLREQRVKLYVENEFCTARTRLHETGPGAWRVLDDDYDPEPYIYGGRER